jgi:hypothetical protein
MAYNFETKDPTLFLVVSGESESKIFEVTKLKTVTK